MALYFCLNYTHLKLIRNTSVISLIIPHNVLHKAVTLSRFFIICYPKYFDEQALHIILCNKIVYMGKIFEKETCKREIERLVFVSKSLRFQKLIMCKNVSTEIHDTAATRPIVTYTMMH